MFSVSQTIDKISENNTQEKFSLGSIFNKVDIGTCIFVGSAMIMGAVLLFQNKSKDTNDDNKKNVEINEINNEKTKKKKLKAKKNVTIEEPKIQRFMSQDEDWSFLSKVSTKEQTIKHIKKETKIGTSKKLNSSKRDIPSTIKKEYCEDRKNP